MSFSEWQEYKLGDVTEYIGRGVSPSYSEIEGVVVLNQRCIREGKVSLTESRLHDQIKKKVPAEKMLKKFDILINSTGTGTLGRIGQFSIDSGSYTTDSHVTIVRAKTSLNPQFLAYYLKSKQKEIENLAEGSTGQTELPRKSVINIDISLPDHNVQNQIASILSSLDDKIELNNQTNQTLETIAQALFKEMCAPKGGELPEGWILEVLGNVMESKGGTTPSTKNEEFWNGDYSWATPKDLSSLKTPVLLSTERTITEKGLKQISSGLLPKGTLLMSSRAPIGYFAIAQVPVAINQGFIAINGISVSNLFLLFWLKLNIEKVKSMGNGSTFLEISKSVFRQIEIVLPSSNILNDFDKQASAIFEAIVVNEKENLTLKTIRDSLLPKLMKGEIEV